MLALLPLLLSAPALTLGTEPPALERGLDTIQTRGIRADLDFIASDELQGRDTPSPGLRIAARYIRARLERLGFTPGGDDGFFDRYSMDKVAVDLERTGARTAEAELVFGDDYYFGSNGFHPREAEGALIWAGDASAEVLYGLDVKGAFVLAWDSPQAQSSARARRLEAAGALGAVFLQPEEVGYRRTNRLARYMKRSAQRGSLRVQVDDLPVIYLTDAGADQLDFDPADAKLGQLVSKGFEEWRSMVGDSERYELENVAGLWPGSDPQLRHEVIVISAHYDHVGVDGEKIYNGADDNGSGTCGLLALADALVEYGPMRRSVLLLWVSGEEKGLKGSYAWTIAPTLSDGYRAVCNLNIDMIGRNAPDYLLITPSQERPEYNMLVKMAEKNAPLEGFPSLGSCDEYWRRSDHVNFSENLGIPVAFLFSDVHEDYHQPTDTVDKVDNDKIRRVCRLILRMLDDLQVDVLELGD